MKILVVGDRPCDALWGSMVRERLKGVDLILSVGDLNPLYLSYLVTFASCPLLYVHGNHDTRYDTVPPEGCDCVDGRLYVYRGIRILGLGGSIRYNGDSAYQYTQRQMRARVRKLWLPLRRHKGFDILLTHAPAYGHGDGEDFAHTGFEVFNDLMDRWQPAYLIHGHQHLSYHYNIPRVSEYNRTRIINGYERYEFEIPDI